TLPAMERGPVPLIVKDNYETTDMPTSAGSLSLKGVMSKTDAFQIKRLRAAGAIMLAKSNMAEFAFDPMETVNSLLPGYTRNPPLGKHTPRRSRPTGFPGITGPRGFLRDSLPVGLKVLGRAWSDPTLTRIVYAYEQATRHRRPPASTPPLPARP